MGAMPYFVVGLVCAMGVIGAAWLMYSRYHFLVSREPEAAHYDDLGVRITQRQVRLSELEDEHIELTQQRETEKRELARLQDEKGELVERAEKAQQWLEENGITLEELRSKTEGLRKEHSEAQAALAQVKEELDGEKQQRQQLDERLDELRREEKELSHALAAHREETSRLKQRAHEQTAELEELARKRAEAEAARADAGLRCRESERKIAEQQEKLDKLVKENSDLEEKLKAQRTEAASLGSDVSAKREELKSITGSIEAAHRQHQAIVDRVEQLARKGAEAEAARADAELRCRESERKVAEQQEKLDKLVKESNELEEKLKAQRTEGASLGSDVSAKREELKSITGSIEAAHRQHQAIVDRVDQWRTDNTPPSIEKRLADLHRPYLNLNGSKYHAQATEAAMLDEFQDALGKHHLVFPERALWAFHTSLKVADISPLVVLAGISGTGKSLLPRLYAEFMGIHFLNVAVQPRWDSPQDLFGFYNYMENCYKATELARLLHQMDIYNNEEKGTKNGRLQDGLAMVLLDEMNLARVEYYFSELLSKLEVRRGLNVKDREKRRQAEIEVESGPMGDTGRNDAGADAKGIRIFVGNNTLFVGTMNEDETTQVLSDKVIDRANVLRFGRPAKAAATPPGDIRMGTGKLLLQTQWSNWQTDQLGEQQMMALRDRLGGINDRLEGIGRPFGRRVQQAIESYVQRYPGVTSPQHLNRAFADQIEQKIIPKLAGLDRDARGLDAAKDEISKAIQYTGDEALGRAFEQAFESDLFTWRGVKREEG